MNYGSVCSGVEAASLAWKPLGWTAKFHTVLPLIGNADKVRRIRISENRGFFLKVVLGKKME